MKWLNIIPPDEYPVSSGYISTIGKIGRAIRKNGYMYKYGNYMFFNCSKIDTATDYIRSILDENFPAELEKDRHLQDFVIWKNDESSPYRSVLGKGLPGWHIECYAMAKSTLGIPFDIHGGGVDLIYPHHINENILANVLDKHSYANYHIHVSHLVFERRKMSKSDRNSIYIHELSKKYDRDAVRVYLLTEAHYREPFEFDYNKLHQTEIRIMHLKEDIKQCMNRLNGDGKKLPALFESFKNMVNKDLDIKNAFELLEKMIPEIKDENKRKFKNDIKKIA